MAKQTIIQRTNRLFNDATIKARQGEFVDIGKRWETIKEDLPEEVAAIEDALGPMPEADLDDVPLEDAVHYACRDADATLRIFPILSEKIDQMGLREVYEMDLAVIPMVERMQSNGMRVDVPKLQSVGRKMTDLMKLEVKRICELTGVPADFNPNSPLQVADLLFNKLKLRATKRTSTGKDSTNDKVLEALRSSHPVLALICSYRELAKARDSFCIALPRLVQPDGRIRCNLRVTRVSSGRLAASSPNLLAIPVRSDVGKEIRECFVPDIGYTLGSWDIDQAEMRYMADESQDKRLMNLFIEGKDVHTATAAWMFGKKEQDVTKIERYAAKRIGFGVITGITESGLFDQMALAGAAGWTLDRCIDAIRGYFDVYRGVKAYIEACRAEARRYGHVRDRWGRLRYLPGVHSRIDSVRAEAERQSHSHKIQSGAQGLLKKGMAAMWPWMQGMGEAVRPLLQIHDSMLLEVKADHDIMEEVDAAMVHYMTQTVKLTVPMGAKGGYGENWAEAGE